jgi:diguanylate cyclase (GGDEF)-like protein
MCQKALVLQTCQHTHSVVNDFLNSCSNIATQHEVNLADAIQQLISDQFDYIICCDQSPEQTLSLLEQLKLAHKIPLDTRILAFSYGLVREHKKQALELGIIDFHDIDLVENYEIFFQPIQHSNPSNILLVEDNSSEARYFAEVLERNGHTVSHFNGVKQAYDAHLAAKYDLVITDLLLVSMYLNKRKLIDDVHTVVMTNIDKPEVLVDLLQLGVTEVINKPILPEEFLLRIERVLKTKQHRDELRNQSEHLLELSLKDSLTGAYNRRYLEEVISQRINFLKRNNEPFSILLLDIDNFKPINDLKGHQTGDKLLIQLVNEIQNLIRNIDCCCRYGGDEFVIVLTGCTVAAAKGKAEQVREQVEQLGMTISVGVAVFDDASQNLLIEEHTNWADLALYQAKKSGKNQVVLYSVD